MKRGVQWTADACSGPIAQMKHAHFSAGAAACISHHGRAHASAASAVRSIQPNGSHIRLRDAMPTGCQQVVCGLPHANLSAVCGEYLLLIGHITISEVAEVGSPEWQAGNVMRWHHLLCAEVHAVEVLHVLLRAAAKHHCQYAQPNGPRVICWARRVLALRQKLEDYLRGLIPDGVPAASHT